MYPPPPFLFPPCPHPHPYLTLNLTLTRTHSPSPLSSPLSPCLITLTLTITQILGKGRGRSKPRVDKKAAAAIAHADHGHRYNMNVKIDRYTLKAIIESQLPLLFAPNARVVREVDYTLGRGTWLIKVCVCSGGNNVGIAELKFKILINAVSPDCIAGLFMDCQFRYIYTNYGFSIFRCCTTV